tara:strand:- start:136 stop:816 length:681 start_codon:yes stop_codon:yes gene_type:complete
MIYIIGDSHVSIFSGTDTTHNGLRHIQPEFGTCYTLSQGALRSPINKFEQRIPYFCPIKIGSNTAWNSYDKLPIIEQAIQEYEITKKDYIFACFGEIDIRNHIGIQNDKNNLGLKVNIESCVNRYFKTILYLNNKYLNVGVYGSPPSSVGWKDTFGYKDVITRNNMTLLFNNYLKEKCITHNIIFKDISNFMIKEDGSTDEAFIMDDIHLSQKAIPLLIEEFKDLL